MDRPRRVSKLRPHEHKNFAFPAPFEAEPPDFVGNAATGESSVLFKGSESLGVNAASLLPLGVAEVKLEESLVAIGVEMGMSASSD